MAEIITDPSFEAQDAAWLLNAQVTFENRGAAAKDGSIVTDTRWAIPGGNNDGRYGQQLTIPSGDINSNHTLSFWIKLRASSGDLSGVAIRVALWDGYFNPSGTGNFGTPPADATVSVTVADITDGEWAKYTLSNYVPGRTDITLGVQGTTSDSTTFSVDVDMDLFSLEAETLAVKLAERAIGEVQTLLAADLETELAAIDTDRADTITTAGTTTAYYTYPRPAVSGGQTHIEIFESEFEFDNPYVDADSSRAVYALPITVRVTFFNRDSDTLTNFTTRARRLATGVFNVFNKKPTLGSADDAIPIVAINRVTPQWVSEGEDSTKIDKAVITIEMVANCEEVQG